MGGYTSLEAVKVLDNWALFFSSHTSYHHHDITEILLLRHKTTTDKQNLESRRCMERLGRGERGGATNEGRFGTKVGRGGEERTTRYSIRGSERVVRMEEGKEENRKDVERKRRNKRDG